MKFIVSLGASRDPIQLISRHQWTFIPHCEGYRGIDFFVNRGGDILVRTDRQN
jgi:hypothetical protein